MLARLQEMVTERCQFPTATTLTDRFQLKRGTYIDFRGGEKW